MVEMLMAMVVSSILVLSLGTLMVAGQRSWDQAYAAANHKMTSDAEVLMNVFGSVGRKSNRSSYVVYTRNKKKFIESEPESSDTEVVYGDAVEFRYWDGGFEAGLLDPEAVETDYAFFYIEDSELVVDYGRVRADGTGALKKNGKKRNADRSMVLAENVSAGGEGAFNHTTVAREGQGCVRIDVILHDPNEVEEDMRVMTATYLRNVWPQ